MEITESVLMVEAEKTVSVIKKLQSYGIQVALDDFGTGFSSLAYLNSFHISILKIDGSFIKNAILDDTGNIITKSIINMARELKIKMVAEGIEKWEQLSYLLNMNCLMGQGYLYSKPLSYEEFGLVLSKGKCEPFIMDEESRITTEDRRKFFRVKFSKLLEANLTLKEFRGKNVNVGNTKVLVKNIGSGGLCFISNIRIPTEQSIVLQFTTKLTGKEIKLYGSPVWSDETIDDFYEYGLEFRISENERMQLLKLLNEVK